MTPNLAPALAFLQRYPRARLFPAHYRRKQHHGLTKWSTETSNHVPQIEAWARKWQDCYFCVALQQSDMAVVDVDNKNGKDGTGSLFAHFAEGRTLPDTLKVQTPSGGEHYLFVGACKASGGKLGPGLDTPVMVPVPGSTVRGKGEYKIALDLPLAPAPGWVLSLAGGPPIARPENAVQPLCELDLEHNVRQCITYLERDAPEAIEGSGGDRTTYEVACCLRDFGVSAQVALDLMLEYWNSTKAFPPWLAEDLERKIRNAYTYAKDRPGNQSLDVMFPSGAGGAGQPFYVNPINWDNVGVKMPPPRRYIWDGPGALPCGIVGVVAGQGGSGKTTLLLQAALSVASGVNCTMGILNIRAHGPVVCVFSEDTEMDLGYNTYHIRQRNPAANPQGNLHVFPRREGDPRLFVKDRGGNLQPTEGYYMFREQLMAIRPALVVIDSLSITMGAAESSNEVGASAISLITSLIAAINPYMSILILMHVNKASQASKSNATSKSKKTPEQLLEEALNVTSVRGAGAIVDNTRWCMVMTLVPQGLRTRMGLETGEMLTAYSVRKTNYGRTLWCSYLLHETVTWADGVESNILKAYTEPVTYVTDQQKKQLLIDYIGNTMGREVSKSDLTHSTCDSLAIPRDDMRWLLKQMLDDKTIMETRDGRKTIIRLTEVGFEQLSKTVE